MERIQHAETIPVVPLVSFFFFFSPAFFFFYAIPDTACHKLPLRTCTLTHMQKYTLRRITAPQQSWDCFKMSEDASVAKYRPLIAKPRMCEEKPHTEYTHFSTSTRVYTYIRSCYWTPTYSLDTETKTRPLLALIKLCVFIWSRRFPSGCTVLASLCFRAYKYPLHRSHI